MTYKFARPVDDAQFFCPACKVAAEDAIAFGQFVASEEEAVSAAEIAREEVGHPIYYDYQEDKDRWALLILDHCAYALAEAAAAEVAIDHYNHPAHYLGQPYNILKSEISLVEAIANAKELKLHDGQSIFIDYGDSGWSVLTSLDSEQRETIVRLHDTLSHEVLDTLLDVYSFREYVMRATDRM